jgi:membrane-bound metal-dependent hydrolase YbcI (DUF457 family)
MTFVGHSLVGASLAQASIPAEASWTQSLRIVNCYVLLAFLPDLPFPGWGHARYYFSHSLAVNLTLMLPLAAIPLFRKSWRSRTGWQLIAWGMLAWLSHFPLDAVYNHGRGVAIFWPFSKGVLNLPLPWFETLQWAQPLTSPHNLRVFGVEALFGVPLCLAAWLLRRFWRHRQATAP